MTVKQLLASTDSVELQEWRAILMLRHEQQRQDDVDAKLMAAFGKKDK